MATDPSSTNIVDQIVVEYLERKQRGESPTIGEYCEKYPEFADEINSLLLTVDRADADFAAGQSRSARTEPLFDEPQLEQIAGYRIIKEIGRGGMGVVYEAEHKSLGRRAAVKILPQAVSKDLHAVERFVREGKAIAKMHHSNIVPLYEVGEEDGRFFLAMQLIDGKSLDRVIREVADLRGTSNSSVPEFHSGIEKLFPPISNYSSNTGTSSSPTSGSLSLRGKYYRQIARIGVQAAEALAYAHQRGFVHRDVKPSNLLLDERGVAWLTDFGLAKSQNDQLTKTGDFVGTLRYMAPERFQGQCTERSDIYALGLTLYEFLALRPAFDSSDRLSTINRITNEEPPRLRNNNRSIPRDLETIVMKSIDKDPKDRYKSASELAADLQRFIADEPIRARRVSLTEHCLRWARRNRGLAASLATVAALLVLIAIGAFSTAVQQTRLRQESDTERQAADEARRSAETAKGKAIASQRLAEQHEASHRLSLYFAQMNLAAQRIGRTGGTNHFRKLTNVWRGELKASQLGWEWYYLRTIALDVAANCLGPEAVDISFDPEDRFVVIAHHKSPTITIRDVKSGELVRTLEGHTDHVLTVEWHPTDNLIVSGAQDQTIRFWDAETGACLWTSDLLDGAVSNAAWNTEVDRLAISVHRNKETSLLLVDEPKIGSLDQASMVKLPAVKQFDANRNLSWSPDGTQIAASQSRGAYGQNLKVAIWNASSRIVEKQPFTAAEIRWNEAGDGISHFLTCEPSGEIRIWDETTRLQVGSLPGHSAYLSTLQFNRGGTKLLSAGYDKTVRVWDFATRKCRRVFQEHPRGILTAKWNSKGDGIASSGYPKDMRFWKIEESRIQVIDTKEHFENRAAIHEVIDLSWHPGGESIAAVGGKHVHTWNVDTGNLVTARNIQWYGRCEWSPSGKRLGLSGDKNSLWTPFSGNKLDHISSAGLNGQDVAWHPAGTQFAIASSDWAVTIYDAATRTETAKLLKDVDPRGFMAVQWNPVRHELIAAGGRDSIVRVINTRDQTEIAKLDEHQDEVLSVAWNVEGTLIASASKDGTIKVWDFESGSVVHSLEGHNNIVNQVDWHPMSPRIASAGRDGSVKIWDTITGAQILSLEDSRSAMNTVEWSPNGRKLAAGNLAGEIIIWDATRGYESDLP